MEMAKVRITRPDGQIFDVSDLSFEQLKELVGVNGHVAKHGIQRFPRLADPDYDALKRKLTDKAKRFLQILRDNPDGISRDHLSEKLGFRTGTQLGGMMGGGIAKHAEKYHIELTDLYTVEVRHEDGQRIVTYKPGKDIAKLQ
jgi:hypothetical protein